MPLGLWGPTALVGSASEVQTSPVNGTGAPTVVGQVGYINGSGQFQTADNGSLPAAAARVIALAVAANGAVVACATLGVVNGLSALTPGSDLFLGAAGAITATAPGNGSGKYAVPLGYALSATSMHFNPQPYIGPL